jgi:hypothetical protein
MAPGIHGIQYVQVTQFFEILFSSARGVPELKSKKYLNAINKSMAQLSEAGHLHRQIYIQIYFTFTLKSANFIHININYTEKKLK